MEISFWFDVIVIVLAIALGVKGLFNGLIKEVFGLIGLIGGGIIASRNDAIFGEFITLNLCKVSQNFCELNPSLIKVIGLGSAWLAFWILCLLVGNLVSKMVSVSGLGVFDRILGFVFGSLKILLVFAILCAIISKIDIFNDKLKQYSSNSYVYPVLLKSGQFIMNRSDEMKSEILSKSNSNNNILDTNISKNSYFTKDDNGSK